MPFRFVHTADLHLDSPLRSLSLRNQDLAALVGDATRQALTKIVDLCIEEQVDALLIAGDLYDGEQTSMKTARFLALEVGRLHEAGIAVFKIRGNHDAMSRITQQLILPPSVKVFGKKAEAVELTVGSLDIAVHGLSFEKPHAPEGLLPKYGRPITDTINIGLMHTSLAGAPGHDLYAPCAVADLHAWGFEYWGLGHIHQRTVHSGATTVIMPGMPQGRDVNESGPKSVSLVTIADDRTVTVEERLTSVAQFERVTVDISFALDWRHLAQLIEAGVARARASASSDHLVVRLRLTGSSALAWTIRRDLDLLKEELDLRAEGIGKTWIEKIELAMTPVIMAASSKADPVIELGQIMDDTVVSSHGFRETVSQMVREMSDVLPPESRKFLGETEADFETFLSGLMAESCQDILAKLKTEQSED